MTSLRLDLTIRESDLDAMCAALASQREYLLAILANLESRKGGYDALEAVRLLSRANALERCRLSFLEAAKLSAMLDSVALDMSQDDMVISAGLDKDRPPVP